MRVSCFHYINVLIYHNGGETASGKSQNHRLAIKSLLELSVSNPGKKGPKVASQVPWKHLDTLPPQRLSLWKIHRTTIHRLVGCAGSKPSAITWSGTEWPLSLLEDATSISFTTLSRVHRLDGRLSCVGRGTCTVLSPANVGAAFPQVALETTTRIDSRSSKLP